MLFFNSTVREEYAYKHTPQTLENNVPHPKNYPLIQINDVAYTVHGLLCTLVVYSQVHFFTFKRNKHQRVSKYTQILLMGVCSLCLFMCVTVLYFPRMTTLHLLDVAEILAYVKVMMSTVKHIPQLLYNHKRRSTKGWAINSTILDCAGAILSICQLLLDAYRTHHMENVFGNSSKLSLALVTIAFNIMFLIQHFILYPSSRYPDVIRLDELGGGAYDNAIRAGAFNTGVINDNKTNPGGPLNIRVGVHPSFS